MYSPDEDDSGFFAHNLHHSLISSTFEFLLEKFTIIGKMVMFRLRSGKNVARMVQVSEKNPKRPSQRIFCRKPPRSAKKRPHKAGERWVFAAPLFYSKRKEETHHDNLPKTSVDKLFTASQICKDIALQSFSIYVQSCRNPIFVALRVVVKRSRTSLALE